MTRLSLPALLAEIVSVRRICVLDPTMVPAVINGVACGAKARTKPKPGVSVEDFVLCCVALGLHQVSIVDGDFGTAICIDDDFLPSRWRDRAVQLRHAFDGSPGSVRDFLQSSGLFELLADLEDAEEIVRFGTPRRAIIVHALVLGLQHDGPGRLTLPEYARFAEPTATDAEITDAAQAMLTWAVNGLADPEPFVRLETGHGAKQEAYL